MSSSILNCFAAWLSDLLPNDRGCDRGTRPTDRLGVRDRGALESALARPQTGYYEDIIQEAAALWESLSQNHPFIDGNKRVAVTATAAFLRVNGYRLEFDDLDAFSFLTGLHESGRMQFSELDRWLRLHAILLHAD